MEVKINREIREYSESIFFGLNLRQLIFSIIAVAAAVAIYFGLREPLGSETVSWLCIIEAAPFAALGFIKYNGMNAEQIAIAWIKSELLMPKELTFKSEDIYVSVLATENERKEKQVHKDCGKADKPELEDKDIDA